MKIQNNENNVSFQKFYAPKNVQKMSDFKALKEYFVSEAANMDIWIWTGKELDKNQTMVEKFFVEVKDFTGKFVGKTKTEKLDSNQLLKAFNRAVEKMDNQKLKSEYNIDDKGLKDIENTVKDFLDLLNGKKKG